MPTVRTTMQPHVELTVDDAEYAELKAQGLLLDEGKQPAAPERESASSTAAAPAKSLTTSGKSSKE